MATRHLVLNNTKISFQDIKSGAVKGQSPFAQATLAFCRQWLNGQATFSLKTSGSTGEPKQITVSREQMQLSARQTIRYFNLSPADTVLVCLNTAYIAGLMMLVRAFASGAAIIAVEPDSNPLLKVAQNIDFMAVVPLQLAHILADEDTRNQLAQCRAVIVGGAPVSLALEQQIKASGANIYATFGMTETLTHFALRQLNPVYEEAFTALEEVTIGQDERGCLTVSSPVTRYELLTTNDVVELQSPNSFKWLGRADNTINSGGVKLQVEALEKKVEQAFYQLGLDYRFFIAGKPDETLGEKVILLVECETPITAIDTLNWAAYFDTYEKPREIIYLKRFAETPTGKINRQATLATLPGFWYL